MAKLGINTGIVPDDGLGDSLLGGAVKINDNFDEIYTYFGDGTNLTFTSESSSQWVTTSAGIHTLSNVGIGTTNPQTSLEVVSGSYRFGFVGVPSDFSPFPGTDLGVIYLQNVDNIFDNSGIANLGDDGGLLLTNYRSTFSNDDGLYRFGPVTNLIWDIYPAYLNQTFDAFYIGYDVFFASVDNRAYVSAPDGIIFGGYGNVGIGTTTPESKLTIIGDAFIGGVVTATSFSGNASSATYADSAGISTNVSGGTASITSLSVSGISTLGTVQIFSGIVTATSGIVTYYGDTSYTTDGRWTLSANGSSDYTFTGIGFTQITNDPVLYLARGRVYEFVNNSGGSHPFEIRVSNGGAAYDDGVTNNGAASGVIRFEIPFNAPNTLYYQCTVHSGMGNTISVYPSTI